MQLYVYFVFLFTISELALLISKRSKKSAVKRQNDGRSLPFLWIIITGCIAAGYFTAERHIWISGDPMIFQWAGIGVTLIGFIIRWTAIIQLGNMFTVDVAISSAHVLKTGGLYNIIRHPSYLGLMLIIAGLALLMNNVLACIIVIVPIFLILNYRISVEEQALTGEFGDKYRQYQLKVKKIIPFIY